MSNTGWLRNWFYFEMWKNHSQHTEAKLPGQMIMRQQFKRIRDILVQVERHDLRPNFMGAVWPCPAICYQINLEPAPYQFITSNLFHAYSPPLLHFRHFYNKQYVSISFLYSLHNICLTWRPFSDISLLKYAFNKVNQFHIFKKSTWFKNLMQSWSWNCLLCRGLWISWNSMEIWPITSL